jgi:alpha-L-fucosidase 2
MATRLTLRMVKAAIVLLLSAAEVSAMSPTVEAIDWPAFMRRQDMIFGKLPRHWTEAPHFGNAMVGSMLYREGNALKLQVFRADAHDHRDDTWGWTAYSRPRFQIGYFLLHTVGNLTGCHWRKDLWNAKLTGTITTDRGEIRIRHFTHAQDMAIITELTPTTGEHGFHWTWHPAEAKTTRSGYPTTESEITKFARQYGAHYAKSLKIWQPNPAGRLENRSGISVWIQDLLSGGQYATAWGEQARGDTRTHVVSIANSYPESTAARTAVSDVKRFAALDCSVWLRAHRDWWHAYYSRSFVTIPDQGLEALYWQTIYRFGCTSRAGRCAVDTPGIWFQGKSWPYFTTDWNIQSAHWPVYAANRLEQGLALVDRLYERRDELIKAVRPVEWQNDSAYLPIEVAWDMIGNREQDMRYYQLVGDLPWVLNNCWSQYRYSMDDAMLREKVYPLLRRAVNLYLHMVEKGGDGRFHLPPTYSPETGVYKDANFDLALFKWGCLTLLKASKRLEIDDPLIPRWKEVAQNLVDFPADEHGFRLGSEQSSWAEHRHFSNLLMIYPLHLVNIEQPGMMEVLRRSYDRAHATRGLPAMVEAHAGPIGAVIGRGDGALDGLKRLQRDLCPNGLWFESPCIESSLAAANIVQNMLIQSWSDPAKEESGPIRVCPAVPAAWRDVEFHDLRTEGAFLVSARRSAGRTQWVRIKSLAGEPCRVRPNMPGEIRVTGSRRFQCNQVSPGFYQIDLKKDEVVTLQSAGDSSYHPATHRSGSMTTSNREQRDCRNDGESGENPITGKASNLEHTN